MKEKKFKHVPQFGPRAPVLGYLILGGFLFVLVAAGVLLANGFYEQNEATESANGVVVGFEEEDSAADSKGHGGGIYYRPIVEYIVAKKQFRISDGAWSGSNMWTIGESLPVRYHRDAPEKAFIDSIFSRWLTPLAFLSAGLLFLIIIVVGSSADSSRASAKDRCMWSWPFLAGQLFCLAFLLPGLTLLIIAYCNFAGSESVTGTVIEIKEKLANNTIYHRAIVEYEVDGKRFECHDLEWGLLAHKRGSKIVIRYWANHPEGVVHNETSNWLVGLCLLVCGVIPELATIVYSMRRNSPVGRTHEPRSK